MFMKISHTLECCYQIIDQLVAAECSRPITCPHFKESISLFSLTLATMSFSLL